MSAEVAMENVQIDRSYPRKHRRDRRRGGNRCLRKEPEEACQHYYPHWFVPQSLINGRRTRPEVMKHLTVRYGVAADHAEVSPDSKPSSKMTLDAATGSLWSLR